MGSQRELGRDTMIIILTVFGCRAKVATDLMMPVRSYCRPKKRVDCKRERTKNR